MQKKGEYFLWCIKNVKNGFTLVELLIVIGVIAVLAAFAFVALNPLTRFQDARNAQRWTDVNAISSAMKLYQVDHDGAHIGDVDNDIVVGNYYQIGNGDEEECNNTCLNPTVSLQVPCVDLTGLVSGGYLASVPIDPKDSGAEISDTRYYIKKNSAGVITVGSCSEEIGSNSSIPEISVER